MATAIPDFGDYLFMLSRDVDSTFAIELNTFSLEIIPNNDRNSTNRYIIREQGAGKTVHTYLNDSKKSRITIRVLGIDYQAELAQLIVQQYNAYKVQYGRVKKLQLELESN